MIPGATEDPRPKVVRKSGWAIHLRLSVKIGPKIVCLFEPIPKGHQLEEVAILRAEANLYKRVAEMRGQVLIERSKKGWPTVRQWYEHWFHERYMVCHWYPPSKHGAELQAEKRWRLCAKYIGEMSMDSINYGVIQWMIAQLRDRVREGTIAQALRNLNAMFKDAIRFGWDDGYGRSVAWRARYNPCDGVDKVRETPTDRTILNDRLLRMLMDTIEQTDGMAETLGIICLQGALGLRIGEATCLQWEQVGVGDHFIDGAGGFIVWRKGRRKFGVPLRLPLPRQALRYLPPPAKAGRVWQQAPRLLARDVNAKLRWAATTCGFPQEAVELLSSHSLRHSFANALRRSDTDVSKIQQALGHTDLKTTLLYLKHSQDYEEVAGAVLPRAAALLG